MTDMPTASTPYNTTSPQRRRLVSFKRVAAALTGTIAIALNLFATPAWAGDPFRTDNARAIDDQTEAGFKALFEEGNYQRAAELLQNASPNEPLAYAIKASLAYMDDDMEGMGENARLTREMAEQLMQTDPLRGHLYTAAGHFLEGAHTISTQGTVQATPTVLGKLQQVFSNLSEAERIDPQDPELNLLKGYMDLMLAVNLPFSDPQQAIERLETFAAPSYLAQRGIAIGYRDLGEQDLAMAAVDRALKDAPDNPDLLYLKAQILVRQNRQGESVAFFQQALEKQAQLPENLVEQIQYEQCRASSGRNCGRFLD